MCEAIQSREKTRELTLGACESLSHVRDFSNERPLHDCRGSETFHSSNVIPCASGSSLDQLTVTV